jgi:O-methyltransferase domain
LSALPPREAVWPLISGARTSQLVYVFAKLGLPDLLEPGPRSVPELAAATGASARMLPRLLRGLDVLDLVRLQAGNRYALTPLGAHLVAGRPDSMHGWAILAGELQHRTWAGLLGTVLGGPTGIEATTGRALWEFLDERPDVRRVFYEELARRTASQAGAILDACDLSGSRLVVDLGGGLGALLAAMLRRVPYLRGILFDRPEVLCMAAPRLRAEEPLAGRYELVAGDLFAALPGGADTYVMKDVLQDWDDEAAQAILARCREAMRAASRLLLIESTIEDGAACDPLAVLLDLQIMMLTRGRLRSTHELGALALSTGLRPHAILTPSSELSVIELDARDEPTR